MNALFSRQILRVGGHGFWLKLRKARAISSRCSCGGAWIFDLDFFPYMERQVCDCCGRARTELGS